MIIVTALAASAGRNPRDDFQLRERIDAPIKTKLSEILAPLSSTGEPSANGGSISHLGPTRL